MGAACVNTGDELGGGGTGSIGKIHYNSDIHHSGNWDPKAENFISAESASLLI